MRERDKPAPRQRFRQQQGYGPVVEDAAGQGHGADAAAPRPGKRQIGKPFRQSKVKPAGQIGDRNACPPQFQQVQKKGCRPEGANTLTQFVHPGFPVQEKGEDAKSNGETAANFVYCYKIAQRRAVILENRPIKW